MPICPHEDFKADTRLVRLSEDDGAPASRFRFEAEITCAQCGVRFRFIGFPAGLSYEGPMVSEDAETLRAPIEPAYVKEILGVPTVSGRA